MPSKQRKRRCYKKEKYRQNKLIKLIKSTFATNPGRLSMERTDSPANGLAATLEHELPHSQDALFICTECGDSFGGRDFLTHPCYDFYLIQQRIHTGEKPYECAECKKSFASSRGLMVHLNFHNGEKPYKCAYCQRCFAQPSTLKRHQYVHALDKPPQLWALQTTAHPPVSDLGEQRATKAPVPPIL